MKPILFIFILSQLTNCSPPKQFVVIQPRKIVDFTVLKWQPYCGGAYPSAKQENGTLSPFASQRLYIKRGIANHDTIPIFNIIETDSSGHFSLHIDNGTYSIIFPIKQESFELFYQKNSEETPLLKAADKNCFYNWWSTPDAQFSISDTTSNIQCIFPQSCHTEFNPCLVYLGQKRK